jgi:elongation factor G
VKIRLLPGAEGSGYIFENRVAASAIPQKFVDAIDAGIMEELPRGVVAGYPIDDLKVELYDGSVHEVDSSEMAFRMAGAMAFQDAAKRARPVVLEPFVAATVTVPEVYLGDVIGNLNSRRGRIESMELKGAMPTVRSMVPLAEMLGYTSDLRRRTEGRAICSMQFDRYELRPFGPPDDDADRIAFVPVPRTPMPKSRDSGVALPEPDSGYCCWQCRLARN